MNGEALTTVLSPGLLSGIRVLKGHILFAVAGEGKTLQINFLLQQAALFRARLL